MESGAKNSLECSTVHLPSKREQYIHEQSTKSSMEPLREKSVPVLGAEGLDPLPSSRFYCETADIAAFAALMYALRDLVGDLRMVVSPKGIRITEMIAAENILVAMSITEDKFEAFECSEEMVVCFEPRDLYDCISRHQNNSSRMTLEVDPYLTPKNTRSRKRQDEIQFMMVSIYSQSVSNGTSNMYEFHFPVALMRSYKQIYKAKAKKLDYFLAIDTTELNSILSMFETLEKEIASKFVHLRCTHTELTFRMIGTAGGTIKRAECKMAIRQETPVSAGPNGKSGGQKRKRKSNDDNNLNVLDKPVPRKKKPRKHMQLYFVLVYILRLQKCFAMNRGYVYLKLRDQYPLSFEIRVGTLGDLYVSLNNHEFEKDDYECPRESEEAESSSSCESDSESSGSAEIDDM